MCVCIIDIDQEAWYGMLTEAAASINTQINGRSLSLSVTKCLTISSAHQGLGKNCVSWCSAGTMNHFPLD